MGIVLNDNIIVEAGKPSESKYLTTGNVAYASTAAVNSAIPISYRYIGLTVLIGIVEYWYINSIADIDLVVKTIPGGGTGTVTNFTAGNLSPLFTSSVATATTTPALTFALSTQTANRVFAGPTTGSAAAPTFRALVANDIPSLSGLYMPITGATLSSNFDINAADNDVYIQNAAFLNLESNGDTNLTAAAGVLTLTAGNDIIIDAVANLTQTAYDQTIIATSGSVGINGNTNVTLNAFAGASIFAVSFASTISTTPVFNFHTGKVTGGLNNNNTHTGANAFQFGNSNSIASSFGAAQFGENGITTSAGHASFMSGEANYIAAYGAVAQGRGVAVTGTYSFVGGWYSPSGLSGSSNTKAPLVSGNGSFGFFETDASQTAGHGVRAASSAILGGTNPDIPSTSPRSVILGGNAIKARASDSDQVYVPNFNIVTTPSNDNTLTQLLARDGTTGQIKYRSSTSLWNLTGNNTLTGNIFIPGADTYNVQFGERADFAANQSLINFRVKTTEEITLRANGGTAPAVILSSTIGGSNSQLEIYDTNVALTTEILSIEAGTGSYAISGSASGGLVLQSNVKITVDPDGNPLDIKITPTTAIGLVSTHKVIVQFEGVDYYWALTEV